MSGYSLKRKKSYYNLYDEMDKIKSETKNLKVSSKRVKFTKNTKFNDNNVFTKIFVKECHYIKKKENNMYLQFKTPEEIKKNFEIRVIYNILTNFSDKYKESDNYILNKNIKNIELTSNQFCYVQKLIEKFIRDDEVDSLNKIMSCVGMYYLEPENCVLVAKKNSVKCMNWFIKNGAFIDKFVCEECIKQNNFKMFILTFVNLSNGSITSNNDIINFCTIAVLNESYQCFEHIVKCIKEPYKIIPKNIIKTNDIDKIDFLFNKEFKFDSDGINYACKHDLVEILQYAHQKGYKFTEKEKNIAESNNSEKCYDFISYNTQNTLYDTINNTIKNFIKELDDAQIL